MACRCATFREPIAERFTSRGLPQPSTTGVFSNVAFVKPIDTHGGVAPTGTCAVPNTVAVDCTANYVFWAHK